MMVETWVAKYGRIVTEIVGATLAQKPLHLAMTRMTVVTSQRRSWSQTMMKPVAKLEEIIIITEMGETTDIPTMGAEIRIGSIDPETMDTTK